MPIYKCSGNCKVMQNDNSLPLISELQSLNKEKGQKFDQDKPPMDLLDSDWLLEVSRVLSKGAEKYGKHNWRNGIAISRLIAAAERHIMAFNKGEDLDKEFELSHIAHASCCLMFIYSMLLTKPEFDDRYKKGKNE